MKTRISLAIVLLLVAVASWGQCNCAPDSLKNKRNDISGNELGVQPYNAVTHLFVKRMYSDFHPSTASFIRKDVLITANHCLIRSPFISKIKMSISGVVVELKKRDFKIYHYHRSLFHKKSKDIAILVLTSQGVEKIESLKYSFFDAYAFNNSTQENLKIHLTGFPCDRQDKLVDKFCSFRELKSSNNAVTVGYPNLFTCKGDSGAPLWYEDNGYFKLISIHHGGNDFGAFGTDAVNIGTKITDDVITWINSKISNN
ncbi:trypsin-like serine peptidase [Flavobacterium flavigenum]|uniref:trypsin-like serine peptidase n=1 Tax=Flavobacterium flavigenum TaxID=3003258 RepID=UPI0022AC54F4|nr:trypsin-like serine protease [Flavobacterium flavigenum]